MCVFHFAYIWEPGVDGFPARSIIIINATLTPKDDLFWLNQKYCLDFDLSSDIKNQQVPVTKAEPVKAKDLNSVNVTLSFTKAMMLGYFR